ncbi:MAG: peptidase U32 family protein [Planctomycetota bacterium]
MIQRPELMSPAGHWPQLQAAIEAGADAVYFGLNHFSARAKVGFELSELPEILLTLHRRGVKGFVTFNTLVFEHELELAEEAIVGLAEAGVDALIVQDLGVARLVREVAPKLPIHGSTQMSITSAEGAELARQFGCSRVVLGRELSLKDIRKIREQTDLELEVFVHGALCVSYSGQCFSSEAWGGRSANRGQCAQACRLSYDLVVDGDRRDLGAARYLLSPGDLYGLEQIPELVELGIACLKIEGRYKESEYVALTTSAYRQAIDAACRGERFQPPSDLRQDLEQIYSRGLGPWFLSGINHQAVVQGRAPRHRGVLVGKVIEVGPDGVLIESRVALRRGDGLVFDAADRRSPELPEQGGFLFDVRPAGNDPARVWLAFDRERVNLREIANGDLVWRTHDPQLVKRLKTFNESPDPTYTRPVNVRAWAKVGAALRLELSDESGHQIVVSDTQMLEPAKSQGTGLEQARQQLGRLGGTPFHLGEFTWETDGTAFVPASLLNRLRREAIEKLLEARGALPAHARVNPAAGTESRVTRLRHDVLAKSGPEATHRAETRLHLLVRNDEQLGAAIGLKPASITLDYLELYGLRPAVERVRAAGIEPRVASPRMLKPAEQKVVRFLLSLECPILVRSGGLLYELSRLEPAVRPELYGDFSLNATNTLAAAALLELGLRRLTPGYDLNAQQLVELARDLGPERIEAVIYQHLPIFHTEHCLFCRFLSSGTDSSNCGHPCEKHRVAVRDAEGREHPLLADVGCRNTMFNAEMQTAAAHMELFLRSGLRDLRLEFVHQTGAELELAVRATGSFLAGQISASELEGQYRRTGPGTTQGSLFVPKDFRQLVQLK